MKKKVIVENSSIYYEIEIKLYIKSDFYLCTSYMNRYIGIFVRKYINKHNIDICHYTAKK